MTTGKSQGGQTDSRVSAQHVGTTTQAASQTSDSQTATEQQEDKKRANARTEAEAQSVDGKAGQSGKSSHDHMGHIKAGTHEGAGGGEKSKRHH